MDAARLFRILLGAFVLALGFHAPALMGQDVPIDENAIAELQQPAPADVATDDPQAAQPTGIDLLTLIGSGGKFMIPIAVMSLLVVTLSVERFISLRRKQIIPKRLVRELRSLADPIERFDPAAADRMCLQYPSIASRVIEAMLERTGQPLGEIERVATDTAQREADDCSGAIRWLNLAAAATPLMGLLGTVWGMIIAFHESTTLSAGRSRSEQLSEGIYTALVTTLAGLIVAIPAAIMAQYLENRLTRLFHRIEELAFDIAPGLARFQGRSRYDRKQGLVPIHGAQPPPAAPPHDDVNTNPPPPSSRTAGGRAVAEQG